MITHILRYEINYLPFPKLKRCSRWSLGMDKQYHPTLYWAYDYLSMLRLNLIHVNEKTQDVFLEVNIIELIVWVFIAISFQGSGCWYEYYSFMMTSSNGNIFRDTGLLCGEFTGDRWIPCTKASDAELWCFLRLNKRLSKQSWGWWSETSSRPLLRHCNVKQFRRDERHVIHY